jgi:outer membrane murein-binding lipoprotein Lpp
MDTHVNPDPDAVHGAQPYSASLPADLREEAAPTNGAEAAERAGATGEVLSPRAAVRSGRFSRQRLLLGGAVVAVLVVGGGVYALSPANHVYPMPQLASAVRSLAAQAGFQRQPVLAPSASLAKINAPLPPPETRGKYTPPPPDAELKEVIGFRGGAGGTATVNPGNATDAGPPPGYVPSEPGMVAAQPKTPPKAPVADQPASGPDGRSDLTTAIVASMHGQAEPLRAPLPSGPPPSAAPPAQIVAPSSPLARPAPATAAPSPAPGQTRAVAPSSPAPGQDPVTVAERLQAGPMTTAEQVDVLQTVTRLAALMHDQKLAVDELRSDVARADADNKARIEDFSRRLALAEARTALKGAEQPVTQEGSSSNADPAVTTAPPPVAQPMIVQAKATVGVQAVTEPRRYRVQAASPGLAMLAQVDRGGGEDAQVAVNVGDVLPGYGKVTSVFQRGTTWVVRTEHGDIGQ